MRITLVSTWKIVNSCGGAERVFCQLANAMADRGHHVAGVCHDFEIGNPRFPLNAAVNFINAGAGRRPPWFLSKLMLNLRALSFNKEKRRETRLLLWEEFVGDALVAAVKQTRPNVIVTFRPEDTHVLLSFGGLDVPVVTMSHNSTAVFLPKGTPKTLKDAVERSAAVQVLMPSYVPEVKALLPRTNVVMIPNAVPQSQKTADRSSHTIVNVGRIVWQKHQDLLVEAFKRIADRYPDWKVEIWGGSPEESKSAKSLQCLIDRYGLTDRIRLCGVTGKVKEKLCTASIFAFPSRWEGFGLALTEAMALGMPSVGCLSCPAVNELIHNEENGLLCEATPEAFAMALAKLMDSEALRVNLGDKAKKGMAAFAPDKVWAQWEELLQSVAVHRPVSSLKSIQRSV